jgi:hypothetical protein
MIATLLGLHGRNPSQTRSSSFFAGYPVGLASTRMRYTLFSKNRFFSIGFSDGVFNEAYTYRGNRPRESVVKHTDSILEGKEKEES